jgi:signal transduction histidine kinase
VTGYAPINLTVVVLSVSISLLLVGMAREGLFDVMPAALSAIAAQHPEGVIVVDSEGHLGYANRRAHELLTPLDLRADRNILETLQAPALRPETVLPADSESTGVWWQALSAPTGVLFELRADRCRWIQVTASPVGSGSAGGKGWLLHVSDATRRHQTELHAAQNRRLESVASLARSVSQDFRGAFAIVRSNAGLLERKLRDDGSQRQLARIHEAARVGSELSHELELYAGSSHSLRVLLDLSQVVEQACELIEADLPVGVDIRRESRGDLLPVQADAIQLRDCIFNLLTNAIDATPGEGGVIDVVTGSGRFDPSALAHLVCGQQQPPDDFAYVKVRDGGGGMSPHVEERAFEPFFSTHHKDRGNGLSAVLGIARAHDALVGLENDPGAGCTFSLYFPLTPTAQSGLA